MTDADKRKKEAIPDGAPSSDAAVKDIEMKDENQEKKRQSSVEVETLHNWDEDSL